MKNSLKKVTKKKYFVKCEIVKGKSCGQTYLISPHYGHLTETQFAPSCFSFTKRQARDMADSYNKYFNDFGCKIFTVKEYDVVAELSEAEG